MRKGVATREHIIQKSAELLNIQGYHGLSISDIMRETGLQKGSIYNHFQNKDEIVLEAFNYAVDIVKNHFENAVASQKSAYDQLLAIIRVYENVMEAPPFVGGCPVMNIAVDSDDTHAELAEQAQVALSSFMDLVYNVLQYGIETGEFKSDMDKRMISHFIITIIEGGVMISKLFHSNEYIQDNNKLLIDFIKQYICK
ncbi:TetR/AcrR family transcriptional regulator [Paenibacillus tyrfis]|uniref:TetR/AcrR family transcriptional regulator n=1 Tax=Paenibacillus tyrfis TaxID=1501230 RepID=UPI00209CCB81|nr:TetR/AcrR family transcriptional regulator [Paenibacillus tyrfis]MCP1312703.1 TetR/AcrR family transcriptional regulator [Paenibacillus tyrfis]